MKRDVERAFHWLEELNYSMRFFGNDSWRLELQRKLAFPRDPVAHRDAKEYLLGAIEHCDELRKAACELLVLIDES